jgi:predicted nucleic acid-binding protein
MVSILRRASRFKALSPERAHQALVHYRALPLTRHGHFLLLDRIFELRQNVSAYDAAYVALAERLPAALLTGDDRLARAVRTHTNVPVLPVG